MSTFNTQGIILRRSKSGEANLFLRIYTKDHGKIEATGRSARKAQGKLKGHLEPFLYCDFMIVHGRKMDIVANSFIRENFLDLRNNFESILAASVIVEIADRMTLEGYRDERVFELLLKTLRFIDGRRDGDMLRLQLAVLFFEINMLSLSGFSPQADRCVICSEKITSGKNCFSFSLGGVMDSLCAQKIPDAVSLDDDVIKLLRFLDIEKTAADGYAKEIDDKFVGVGKLHVESMPVLRAILLMKNFIEFNIDQKINSLEIFCNFARGKI